MTPRTAIDTLADLVCIALVALLVFGTHVAFDFVRTGESVKQQRNRLAIERIAWERAP